MVRNKSYKTQYWWCNNQTNIILCIYNASLHQLSKAMESVTGWEPSPAAVDEIPGIFKIR